MLLPADLLSCPTCRRGGLGPSGEAEVRCGACEASFPVVDGVIDLLPGVGAAPSPAQRTMEGGPILRIYESRLWRRSPFVAFSLGIGFEREAAIILREAALRDGDTVLDLAGGPGIYTRRLARAVGRGVALNLDLSRAMLAQAQRRVLEEGLDNVVLVHGDASSLPFPDARLDAVNCCGALHLFPDVPRVLSEIARALRPGGRFTVACFRSPGGRRGDLAQALFGRFGLQLFTPARLESLLLAASLDDVRVHHARRRWLIASARRPARS